MHRRNLVFAIYFLSDFVSEIAFCIMISFAAVAILISRSSLPSPTSLHRLHSTVSLSGKKEMMQQLRLHKRWLLSFSRSYCGYCVRLLSFGVLLIMPKNILSIDFNRFFHAHPMQMARIEFATSKDNETDAAKNNLLYYCMRHNVQRIHSSWHHLDRRIRTWGIGFKQTAHRWADGMWYSGRRQTKQMKRIQCMQIWPFEVNKTTVCGLLTID